MGIKSLREFIKAESTAGFLLLAAAILALVIDNSSWAHYYHDVLQHVVSIHLGFTILAITVHHWVNDGLMAVFFLLVGLEIKREILVGELSSFSCAVLPGIAAIGGMLFPAIVYCLFNFKDTVSLQGWAIPTATDIAFSLGILAVLGSKIPSSLKVFLTALAIFDDIGAIVIIAIFYTANVSVTVLALVAGLLLLLFILNRLKIQTLAWYLLVGFALWVCVLKSGVHATLAGIVLAFMIPLKSTDESKEPPLDRLEHFLNPWVTFVVLPLFAFTNAGVDFSQLSFASLVNPISIGIAAGLFLGKQFGICFSVWLGVKSGFASMPKSMTSGGIYGVSLLCGVGFTMSLFIGSLAFDNISEAYEPLVRVGVIAGSLLSGVVGYIVLNRVYSKSN